MKKVQASNRFLRDLKLAKKRGKDLRKVEAVIDALARGEALAKKHRPHRLKGDMRGLFECHIEPDWLLIWDEDEAHIYLARCGTHSDLFD